jgi:hypothetical protein
MDEPRECRLAAILARGLARVRQRSKRAAAQNMAPDDAPRPTAAELANDDLSSTAHHAAGQQGEPQ